MIMEFIDIFLQIVAANFGADVFFRLFKVCHEFKYFSKRYLSERRLQTIAKRAFAYNSHSILLLLILVFGVLLRFGIPRRIHRVPSSYLMATVLVHWIFKAISFSHSLLDDADWIRAWNGLDYGEGMASNYYHGYLKLVMPSHTGHAGLRERMDLYAAQQHATFIINRLVILIPNIMFVPPKFESVLLEKANPLETARKDRAGVYRPFKTDVYRFTEPINGKYYYIAMEGATPLLSFYEAMTSTSTGTFKMCEMQREILFKFYHHLKRLLEQPETQREVELVFYNAYKADGSEQDVGEMLIAHFQHILANRSCIDNESN